LLERSACRIEPAELSVRLTETTFAGLPALRLSSDHVALVILPSPGGRIISLQLDGTEIFYIDSFLIGAATSLYAGSEVRAEKRQLGWRHFGGDKTWLAPQGAWTDGLPFLDLDSGAYELNEIRTATTAGVRVASPVCRETGVQVARTIALDKDGTLQMRLELTNRSHDSVSWGLWDVTQVRGPGRILFPIRPASDGLDDVRLYPKETPGGNGAKTRLVKRESDIAIVTCSQTERFKFGTDNREGWMLGLVDRDEGTVGFLRSFDTDSETSYPHGSTGEVYDSDTLPYFEMETHGPRATLAPGQSYARNEEWVLDWFDPTTAISEWLEKARGRTVRSDL
jgi:hypothetical protein